MTPYLLYNVIRKNDEGGYKKRPLCNERPLCYERAMHLIKLCVIPDLIRGLVRLGSLSTRSPLGGGDDEKCE